MLSIEENDKLIVKLQMNTKKIFWDNMHCALIVFRNTGHMVKRYKICYDKAKDMATSPKVYFEIIR